MNIATFFSSTPEWIEQGCRTLAELRVLYPEASLHALVLPVPGAPTWDPPKALGVRRVVAPAGVHASIGDTSAPRLIAVDAIKADLGRVLGLRNLWYVEADVSVIRRFDLDQPDAPLCAPVNKVSDRGIRQLFTLLGMPEYTAQIDNGLMHIRDVAAVHTTYKLVLRDIAENAKARAHFNGMYVPGVGVWSAVLHMVGGRIMRPDTATNWHAMEHMGRTDVIHNTGQSKNVRPRLRFGPIVGGEYNVTIGAQ